MQPSPLDLQQTTTVCSQFLIFTNLLILISIHIAYYANIDMIDTACQDIWIESTRSWSG